LKLQRIFTATIWQLHTISADNLSFFWTDLYYLNGFSWKRS